MPKFVDEVIVVDNDSTDGTAEVARRMGARVIQERVRGYGRAYKTGLLHAQGDVIVTLDGDHSYPVDALSYLLEALLNSRVGFISASRFPIQNPDVMAFKNLAGNKIISLIMSLLYLRRIRDSQSGMWIFYKDALKKMDLRSDAMAFSEEIKIEALRNREIGFKEIPIDFSNRAGRRETGSLERWMEQFDFSLQKTIWLEWAQHVQKFHSWRTNPEPKIHTVTVLDRSVKSLNKASLSHRNARIAYWNSRARKMAGWRSWGGYYHRRLEKIYQHLVPVGERVLEIGCGQGALLAALRPRFGVGVDFSEEMAQRASKLHPSLHFIQADAHELHVGDRFGCHYCFRLSE